MTQAGRGVIAGDSQQLPPTRFFETGVAASETEEIRLWSPMVYRDARGCVQLALMGQK